MALIQSPSQRQTLSQAMTQALAVLQMPLPELYQYISNAEMDNPLLDISMPDIMSAELPQNGSAEDIIWENEDFVQSPYKHKDLDASADFLYAGKDNFFSFLHHQLAEDANILPSLLPLCHFVVDSLNARGYLEDSSSYLAELCGVSEEDMTQAVYAVQELDPTGVGAHSLQECLILQLVKTSDFNAHTVKLVKEGLNYLAVDDIRAIAKLLNVSKSEAAACCAAIRRLNPIPSRGYDTGDVTSYVIPEAEIFREGDRLVVHYHDGALPQISINSEYKTMLAESDNPQLVQYLKQHLNAANQLIQEVSGRKRTVTRILECLTQRQRNFFESGFSGLVPLMPSDVAEELGVSRTTVSRAVREKYVMTPVGLLEMKRLFSFRAPALGEESTASVKARLASLIAAEDTRAPFSDERLCESLQAMGITISRRTVAKYRESMGIPTAARRRRGS